jgi:hypothetical protein
MHWIDEVHHGASLNAAAAGDETKVIREGDILLSSRQEIMSPNSP